jgi:hypothetical protein
MMGIRDTEGSGSSGFHTWPVGSWKRAAACGDCIDRELPQRKRKRSVGNYGVSEVERSETRSLNVCALCLGARPTGV